MLPQPRGYALERLLRDLFDAFDLDPKASFRVTGEQIDPKASFRVTGEQIDGGFTIDNTHFVLEAKWEKAPAERGDLDEFQVKVERRADITQGLFVAIEGFEPTAVDLHSRRGSHILLMDGGDLYSVLDARIDLRELLRRKLRHAAMTGEILHTATQILSA